MCVRVSLSLRLSFCSLLTENLRLVKLNCAVLELKSFMWHISMKKKNVVIIDWIVLLELGS